MMKLNFSFLRMATPFLAAAIIFACSTEEQAVSPNEKSQISEEVKTQFMDLGFDVSDITTTEGMEMLDPSQEAGYILEGDIVVSQKNFEQMLASKLAHVGPNGEQYRTNNLVSSPKSIRVIGYTGNNSNGLDSKMRTGLQRAVANFNQLNLELSFSLDFGTNYNAYDIVVYRVSGGGGGSAGFPSGGNPYKWVQIQSGTSNYSTDVVEHVMTHEMGHCVGLRHTDYFDRSYSCGSGGNEGDGGVGAVHIPGTPTGVDPNSIMLSCFNSGVNGEFSTDDRDALNYLY